VCEVVLNYVEVGAIARCVVVSVVLQCYVFAMLVCCVGTADGMLYCFFVALC
jgi:hypothetical protein